MHAVYCFLTGSNPISEFLECVSSEIFRLDENNWYQEMCAVTKKGEVTLYCDANDWRGRDWLGKQLLSVPPEERWKNALEFAESCVAWEVGQSIQMLTKENSEAETLNLDSAVPELRKTLQKNATKANAWALTLATRSIEQLEYREGPFTRDYSDPYSSLRAVALTEKSIEDEEVCILFVDIHT